MRHGRVKLNEMLLDGRKKKGGVKMNRGRKDGNEMKNHEGYYDPTAGKAIRRAARHKRRKGIKLSRLTYQLREVQGFPVSLVK